MSEILMSLAFPEMNRRLNDVSIAEFSTCRWLKTHPSYKTWAKAKSSLLWVKGHPGSGKSTLMKYALSEEIPSSTYVASFFFNGRGSAIEKATVGLYRSLLHLLLPHAPNKHEELARIYRNRCDTQGDFGIKWSWHEKELELWLEELLCFLSRAHAVTVYVDALDESGKEVAVKLVTYFQKIVSKTSNSGGSLKVCLSCRHYPLLPGIIGLALNVENENHADIADFSRTGFANGGVSPEKAQVLETAINEKANGIFQWAVIVVPRMIDLFHMGTKLQKIQEVIKQLPEELDELYREIMKTIPNNERRDSLLLVQWICCAVRPLSLDEMRYAAFINKDVSHTSLTACQEDNDFIDANADMEKKIKHFVRGLAEVKKQDEMSWIQFIHQSVQDYFITIGLQLIGDQPSDCMIDKVHFQLAWSCVRYIEMEELSTTRHDASTPEMQKYRRFNAHRFNKELAETYPFAEYASFSWALHTAQAELDVPAEELMKFFDRLDSSKFGLLENWIFLVSCKDLTQSRKMPCPTPEGFTALHIMACYGLSNTLSNHLAQRDVEADRVDKRGRTPLSYAANNGHEKVVRLLLNRKDVTPDIHDSSEGETPLSEAARYGHLKIVQLLVSRNDVDVDSRNRLGQTALSQAAGFGAISVVKFLMDRKDVNVDSTSHEGRTSLYYAAKSGHVEVVKLLLGHKGVNPQFVDPSSTQRISSLMIAAEGRHVDVVKILLKDPRVDANFVGHEGRTALSYAAGSGHKEVVQLLIHRTPTTVDLKDTKGLSPLSHAAKHGHKEVVEELLNYQNMDLNSRDKFGRTPLSWAAGEGREEAVQTLLLHQGVESDTRDDRARTPLSYAAGADLIGVVEMLLQTGNIDVNSADVDGRTPLTYAARALSTSNAPGAYSAKQSNKDADTVALYLLKQREINADRPDGDGKTPLSWAANSGKYDLVKSLLTRNDVNKNSKDAFGRTPLMNAVYWGKEAVLHLLLNHPDVDVNCRDDNGETALSFVITSRSPVATDVVQQFLNCERVETNSRDAEGRTPLSYAAEGGLVEVVRLLVQSKGIIIASKDKYGRTPYSYARSARYQAIMELLGNGRR